MANEITMTVRAQVVNGDLKSTFDPGVQQYTQTTLGLWSNVVSVGSGAEEDLTLSDITTPGILCMMNLDSTNYVDWGPKSGGVMVPVGRIKAGEMASFRVGSSVTIRWQANTAACKVLVWLLEA